MAIHKVTVRGVTYDIGDESFVLPVATAETIGGVKIGDGISIAEDGTISAEGSGGGSFVVNFNYDESTDTYSADKTFAEIQDAIQKGYYVCGIYDESFFNLNTYSETYNDLTFNSVFVEEDSLLGNPTLYREFYINSANEIEYYEVANKIPSSGGATESEWKVLIDHTVTEEEAASNIQWWSTDGTDVNGNNVNAKELLVQLKTVTTGSGKIIFQAYKNNAYNMNYLYYSDTASPIANNGTYAFLCRMNDTTNVSGERNIEWMFYKDTKTTYSSVVKQGLKSSTGIINGINMRIFVGETGLQAGSTIKAYWR